ncbi:MAG: transposase [Ktedonobacteraceae bacterium]|nr:transposase [Ktedonobacteraceae bacterium]
MIDVDTFVTILYVMIDDFCQQNLPPEGKRPGPQASLSRSEVVTLALFGQWSTFSSERGFYRFACRRLRSAFPTLPDRGQFNRLLRGHHDLIVAFSRFVLQEARPLYGLYELVDSTAAPTRDARRRGVGWMPGQADIGWSNRVGWYEGLHVLCTIMPSGLITGFGFGSASAHDHKLLETFLAARAFPQPGLECVGPTFEQIYIADKGFAGARAHERWSRALGAQVITAPNPRTKRERPWSRAERRWLASLRQVIESVYDKLLNTFRLARERPHHLTGFRARLAAKVALHNFCLWLYHHFDRNPLAFADLLDW